MKKMFIIFAGIFLAAPCIADVTHTIKERESLWDIATKYLKIPSKYSQLLDYNNISSPSQLKPGDKLVIPDALLKDSLKKKKGKTSKKKSGKSASKKEKKKSSEKQKKKPDGQSKSGTRKEEMPKKLKMISAGLELFHEKKYYDAFVIFQSLAAKYPEDTRIKEFLIATGQALDAAGED